ncbi:3-oxoacid CoA-transferase subunit B [Neorhizobium alkalisoli]|uniref:3-oxoadipate CoA-transferase beta subunit n=1 Tax=Neorhizobium alkalisoli TaxID=528178 RepID=A0A561QAP0_9HYPH|nr:3-oxoacid CoA-transferase subunit B [Neorhizobium alkalisoli]TWF47432.1 3-oxoadipate CoA-transferase beta subunit [Neorhizobium alkalisoli]
MTVQTIIQPQDREAPARRLARDIEDGWYVNLGVGMPTKVADMINDEREVVFHSENGILGMGPTPPEGEIDPWLVNAGKKPVTLLPGASLFHHADSFTMIRGGHIDLCVLGAFEVSQTGDLANWTTGGDELMPAVGGAMDLSVGAKRIWVLMQHNAKGGESKLVEACSYPLTAPGAVSRIYTDLGVFGVADGGFYVIDLAEGVSLGEARARTGAPLHAE